jgi:hypothetical protein
VASCGEGSEGSDRADREKAEQERKERHQPSAELAEVVTGAGEEVAAEMAVRLHAADPWPMPARRRTSRRIVGVTPRLYLQTKTQLVSASWPRQPQSTWARSMVTRVMRSI